MTEFALVLCLLLFPLTLRWITAWQIGQLRHTALKGDEEFKKMAGELNEIQDAIYQVERKQRHYVARRSLLYRQIEAARAELVELRRPANSRIAA